MFTMCMMLVFADAHDCRMHLIQPRTESVELYRENVYLGKPVKYWRSLIIAYPKQPYCSEAAALMQLSDFSTYLKPGPLRNHDPKTIPVLIDLLSDTDPSIRIYAAETLGMFRAGARQSVATLSKLIHDDEVGSFGTSVSVKALMALAQIGVLPGKTVKLIKKRLDDPKVDVRCSAALALLTFDPTLKDKFKATRVLLNALDDSRLEEGIMGWAAIDGWVIDNPSIISVLASLSDENNSELRLLLQRLNTQIESFDRTK